MRFGTKTWSVEEHFLNISQCGRCLSSQGLGLLALLFLLIPKMKAPQGINFFWSLLKWRTTHCFVASSPHRWEDAPPWSYCIIWSCFCDQQWWPCVTGWVCAHFGMSPNVDHIISDQPSLLMIWKFCRDECVLPKVSGAGL